MKTKEQLKRGAVRFIVNELAPKLPAWKAIAVEAFAPQVVEAKLGEFFSGGILAGTPFVQGEHLNEEEAYRAIKEAASGRWPFELFGFQFSESDLDRLYQYIREA